MQILFHFSLFNFFNSVLALVTAFIVWRGGLTPGSSELPCSEHHQRARLNDLNMLRL